MVPGNTLMDDAIHKCFRQPYDKDGEIARRGKINQNLLSALQEHPFFALPFPKTTGPELFNLDFVEDTMHGTGTKPLSPADLVASLTAFSARSIINPLKPLLREAGLHNIYLSGGGIPNSFLSVKIMDAIPTCRFGSQKTPG